MMISNAKHTTFFKDYKSKTKTEFNNLLNKEKINDKNWSKFIESWNKRADLEDRLDELDDEIFEKYYSEIYSNKNLLLETLMNDYNKLRGEVNKAIEEFNKNKINYDKSNAIHTTFLDDPPQNIEDLNKLLDNEKQNDEILYKLIYSWNKRAKLEDRLDELEEEIFKRLEKYYKKNMRLHNSQIITKRILGPTTKKKFLFGSKRSRKKGRKSRKKGRKSRKKGEK